MHVKARALPPLGDPFRLPADSIDLSLQGACHDHIKSDRLHPGLSSVRPGL